MKLSTRSIFWTVVAAVFFVANYNMLMSLNNEARAIILTLVVVLGMTVPGFVMLAFAAGKRSNRTDEADTDDDAPAPTDHGTQLAKYWQRNGEVVRSQMEARSQYERGRDDALAAIAHDWEVWQAQESLTGEMMQPPPVVVLAVPCPQIEQHSTAIARR